MRRQTVYGYTLGCRLNACETEAILDEILRRCSSVDRADGPEAADIIVVNTCAVTGRSQARSRKAVRAFARMNPDALVTVTGCVAEVAPEDFSGERVLIVPNSEKPGLAESIARLSGFELQPSQGSKSTFFPGTAPGTTSRTRAFLKIQDGCDNSCTYCIVPLARGGSVSQPREIVLEQVRSLSERGCREIVLTGIDIARYGRDLYGSAYGLSRLVREMLEIGGFRIRISSIEPVGLDCDLLKELSVPSVCRHFHLPLQSGSDRILTAMGRRYGRKDIMKLLDTFVDYFPGAALGADLIVGFPGETEEEFRDTMDLASDERIAYLHVFPFSPRPGTKAWDMDGRIHPETVSERAVMLRAKSAESRRRFRLSMMGEEALILVEARTLRGTMIGLTDNYIPLLSPEGSTEGTLVSVTVTEDNICWELR